MELGKEQPLELMRLCSLRARFSENLASKAGYDQQKSEYFFMGLFSCIDVMLGRPMEEILEDLPIRTSIKEALLGKSNLFRLVLDLVISYEKANWIDFPTLASRLGVEEPEVQQSYSNSIEWADQVI